MRFDEVTCWAYLIMSKSKGWSWSAGKKQSVKKGNAKESFEKRSYQKRTERKISFSLARISEAEEEKGEKIVNGDNQ